MIDGSEKCNRQLAFELQNSHVCEKRSKMRVNTRNTPTISNSSLIPIIQYKKGGDQGLIVINYDQRYQV